MDVAFSIDLASGDRGAGRAIGDARAMLPLDLVDVVFSWTLDDIYNPDLYRNEIVEIPLTFKSVIHYLGSYIFPLLEEIRECFCSSVETISTAPFSEISSICAHRKNIYYVRVQSWRNGDNNYEDVYMPTPGDILIFSNVKPETVADFDRFGTRFLLAMITEGDKEFPTSFQVKTLKEIEGYDGMGEPLFAMFLLNLTTYARVWKALNVGLVGKRDMSMIKEVLGTIEMSQNASCSHCNYDLGSCAISECLLELNESQSAAVLACAAELQCSHRRSIKLIWGPPGTGKTKTISELLWISLSMNHNVLTCAPTNVSVIEVSSRFLDLVYRKRSIPIQDDTVICLLGDILLLGNSGRLQIPAGTDLNEIFLDHRVDILIRCFEPSFGWKHCISSLQDFLKNHKSYYNMHLENERKEQDVDNGCAESAKVVKSFTMLAEFFRKRFSALVPPLRRCILDLCTHMPVSFLSEMRLGYLKGLINILDHFHYILSKISDEDLEYSLNKLDGVLSSSDVEIMPVVDNLPDLICNTWKKCLNVLKLLHDNMPVPTFFEIERVRDFCLNSAKVLFCTASTSFKILRLKSFDLLVIDEASQLKECESTIPLQLYGVRHAILIGDEHQLPSTVKSKLCEYVGFGRSLFERLSTLGHSKHLLKIQYRMHPSISLFPNQTFYNGLVIDAPNVCCQSYEKSFLPGKMYCPFSLINVVDGKEELLEVGNSRKNVVEASVILQIVHNVFKAVDNGKQKVSIGVISPYEAQVALIQTKIGKTYDALQNFRVRVKSIDGFQGSEDDIIIISLVRSNQSGSIGFLSNYQRANVALTRARHCLWIIGNFATISKSRSVWERLVRDAESRHCLFNADEDKSLSKAVVKAKKELDQLDDLLNKDSLIFRNAKWKVLFSDNFKKSFTRIKSNSIKRVVLNFLLKLAEGWRPRWCTTNSKTGSKVRFVRQYKVEGLHVIWTTDLMRISLYTQVLKVWDILPLCEIPDLVKRLENIFLTYTDDYIARCNAKSLEGKLEVPVTWNPDTDAVIQYNCPSSRDNAGQIEDSAFNDQTYAENSKVSESLILMKFYSLSSGVVGHLLSESDGRELVLPFEVTDEERDVILFPRSAFILGRSGTGKTTILTTKLIQREQLYLISSYGLRDSNLYSSTPLCMLRGNDGDSECILRQLFVTVSPKLCSAISLHIHQMRSLLCVGERHACTSSVDMYDISDDIREFAELPDNFSDLNVKDYPLIITFKKFLMMLDGSVGSSFFTRFHELRGLQLDNRGYWRFPAFHAFLRRKEVSFDRFASVYWPHFSDQLTKKLDSSIVFKEIISHIKGDLVGEMRADGFKRDDYIRLAENRSSILDTQIRNAIFDIYLDYERKKSANGDFDISDFVSDIHHRLRTLGGYVGDKVDFVYVDEVQDLTMKQIALFKYMSTNIDGGFVFAGDTAQTIARGIDFRFQDVRSLFYSEFLSCEDGAKAKQSSVCNLFHLSQNFRTHAGILKLGQSVIDLLYFFFPQSIDRLSSENSLIYGEAPILLECKDENALATMFGRIEDGDTYNGFGAEQVILVRDNLSKEEILPLVNKRALILTILECKGLEFQDVLLYNFFGSSPLKHHWRVIYHYMKSHSLLDACTSYPCFEVNRHNILCSELKQLYVAITRTRQRLWVCEMEKEYARPIFDYWKKLCLVQTRELDDNLVQAMQVASTKEEWRDRGTKLFREGNFEMATMCFERVGDLRLIKWARAAALRASGIQLLDSNYEMAGSALTQAAEIYEAIGKIDTAAECYIDLRQYKRAGLLYLEKCGETRLEEAGDCFFQAGCWTRAAEVYAKANNVSKCLSACSEGKQFELGLKFIESWKNDDISRNISRDNEKIDEVKNSFLESCALYYHGMNDKTNMMKYVRSFTSIEFIRIFLTSRACLNELMLIEEEHGNWGLAAEIARQKGDLLFESKMLEKTGHYEEASKLILLHITITSLWGSGRKACPPRNVHGIEILLNKAVSLSKKVSDTFFRAAQLEACILAEKSSSLKHLGELLDDARTLKNIKAEYFTTRKILDFQLQSEHSKFDWQADARVPTMTNDDNVAVPCGLTLSSLMHIWNLWKELVASILAFLNSFENGMAVQSLEWETFCFEYFGVRKNESDKYIILNSEACWIRDTNCITYCKIGDVACLEGRHFRLAAYSHWSSEIFLMGVKVKQKLRMLHDFSAKKPLPLFVQGVILLDTFLVSKFLVNLNNSDANEIQYRDKLEIIDIFLKSIFPFDWRRIITKEMTYLRESDTTMHLMRDAIIGIMNSAHGSLTYGQIGRGAMLLLRIKSFGDRDTKICSFFPEVTKWHSFVEHLQQHTKPGFRHISIVSSLHDALRVTFHVNWRRERDYISPNCFLYLLERLLFLASYCRGFYFTTTSSFIEGMSYLGWDASTGANLLCDRMDHNIVEQCYNLVLYVAHSLISNMYETVYWMRNSRLPLPESMHLLVLRLVIMVGLVHANTGRHFKEFVELLHAQNVYSHLPRIFAAGFERARTNNFLDVFADTLKLIQDPLVMVGFRRDQCHWSMINAVKMVEARGKDQMLDMLFPNRVEGTRHHDNIVTPSHDPPSVHQEGHCNQDNPSGNKASYEIPTKQASSPSNVGDEESSPEKLYTKLWSTLETMLREQKQYDGVSTPNKHVIIQKVIEMLNNVAAENVAGEFVNEIPVMLDELKQLTEAFKIEDKEHGTKKSASKELLSRLCQRKMKLQPILDSLILKTDSEAPKGDMDEKIQEQVQKQPTSKVTDDDRSMASSQSKHQKKKAKKSKGKGKGKGKR